MFFEIVIELLDGFELLELLGQILYGILLVVNVLVFPFNFFGLMNFKRQYFEIVLNIDSNSVVQSINTKIISHRYNANNNLSFKDIIITNPSD